MGRSQRIQETLGAADRHWRDLAASISSAVEVAFAGVSHFAAGSVASFVGMAQASSGASYYFAALASNSIVAR
jgi:hypothetical protein